MRTFLKFFPLLVALLLPNRVLAQYSAAVFVLKQAQDLYDERGFNQGAAISVDGKLAVSNQNGTPSYSYPISAFTSGGMQVNVSLNYCGSVQFTAFKDYNLSDRFNGTEYDGWARFHQNRPTWILSVNNWAVNVLTSASHFHVDPNSDVYNTLHTRFTDQDLVWLCDGYDFSNRMRDFGAVANGEPYRDMIRVLRGDGSVLELLNSHTKTDISNGNPDTCARLYSGFYYANEANSHGYGIVEFDSTLMYPEATNLVNASVTSGQRYPLFPRVLRYYAGDGSEAIFREWVTPFGLGSYRGLEEQGGGYWGHPSVFYLEEIRSNAGTVVEFSRTRHTFDFNQVSPPISDSTRGRALVTRFTGHELSFGLNSMTIEALGRTTKVKFDTVMRSGNAEPQEMSPYGDVGIISPLAEDLAEYDEENPELFKSFASYVTRIIDPENRVTAFGYESYTKNYKGFGFPHPNTTDTVTLRNYRLKSITEPAARYMLAYHGPLDTILLTSTQDPVVLNNVIDSVRKEAPDGSLLLSDRYILDDADNLDDQTLTSQITIDYVAGHTRQLDFVYENYPLLDYGYMASPSRHTVLKETTEKAGPVTTVTNTAYGTSGWGNVSKFVVLPTSQVTTINGIAKSHQEFYYTLDTLRDYWSNPSLGAKYGMEITRKITRTLQPDSTARTLLVDTTLYLHLPMIDTNLTWFRLHWDKFKSLANFFYLRDTAQDPAVVGRTWDELSMRPPVAEFRRDTVTEHIYVPPSYGLAERSWTTDSGGAVTGTRNVYMTDFIIDNQRTPRGALLADSVLGSDGRRILKGEYTYRREWNGPLLASSRNALGVPAWLSYGYGLCEDVPYWDICPEDSITGTIISNDGTSRQKRLTWSQHSWWFAKPAAERRTVRHYDAFGVLQEDTLATFTERTFHGLPSATVDANGYYSRFAYDYNGRLDAAWLPYDFPGEGVLDTFTYEGPEYLDLLGVTHHHYRTDTLHCWRFTRDFEDIDTFEVRQGTSLTTVNHDSLLAYKPVTKVPDCPCAVEFGAREKKDNRALLATCNQYLPYNQYAAHKGYFGVLPHVLDSLSPLKNALRLDSMHLDLMVTSVRGECAHLVIAIDSVYSKTFVFACNLEEEGPIDDDDPPEGRARRSGRALQSSSVTRVEGGYRLHVDLTSAMTQLAGRAHGARFNIELRSASAGSGATFINGSNAEDLRPRLSIYGEYRKVWDRADYTIAYEHDDDSLRTTVRAKVDDARHTNNKLTAQGISVRRGTSRHSFGAGYNLLMSERTVIEPGTTRTDTVQHRYSGFGARTMSIDPERDSVATRHDAMGRPVTMTNADSSVVAMAYLHATPDSLGFTDQDFYGYCDGKITTNEDGLKFAQFTDAFGRLRREIASYGTTIGDRNLTTRYDYDMLGRLVQVINPKSDTTRYTHDEFGRVKTKSQPDLGMVSYAYDDLGNVRFSQDAHQASRNLMTFNQYDDLNRLTLIGEAYIDQNAECDAYDEDQPTLYGCGNGSRLTDSVDGNVLHVPGGSIVTANPGMFTSPSYGTVTFPSSLSYALSECELEPQPALGESDEPSLPLIRHDAVNYENDGVWGATLEDFEDISWYPDFARIAVQYDTLPIRNGAVWYGFPTYEEWNALAPTGQVRNLRGRESAVAYRDKSYEPFHYAVMSYDERGRVEALMRYNENLGFDAVYYTYNSSNQVLTLTVADPLRRFTTWYGYDAQGRIDTVWTKLEGAGTGLIVYNTFDELAYPGMANRSGAKAEITYTYTKTDQVATMRYPEIGTLVEYAYNQRKFLDTLIAKRPGLGGNVFTQQLQYDASGQISNQTWRHGAGTLEWEGYNYDDLQQLTLYTDGNSGDYKSYVYNEVGGRTAVTSSLEPTDWYGYFTGTNRLQWRDQADGFGNNTINWYAYNANGARTSHWENFYTSLTNTVMREDHFTYSFRGLMTRTHTQTQGQPWEDWRYRYSAGGEREQKRSYPDIANVVPAPDSLPLTWVYYLLGGNKEQLAVYHGQQFDSLSNRCGHAGQHRVYMYPVEYITYGSAIGGSLITKPTGAKEYKIVDHLGSTRVVLDTSGSVINRTDYEPFGTPIAVTGVGSRKKYIDREFDDESETYNTGLRQYDAGTAFGSADPMWEKYPMLSPYVYAANNPIRRSDPNGDTIVIRANNHSRPVWAKLQIQRHLKTLKEQSPFAAAIIKDLEGSKNLHVINVSEGMFARSGPHCEEGGSADLYLRENSGNGVGTGSSILIHPFYNGEKFSNEIGPGHLSLFNELGHSWLYDKGIANWNTWYSRPGEAPVYLMEQMVHGFLENMVRRDLNMPIRMTYGGVYLPLPYIFPKPPTPWDLSNILPWPDNFKK